MRKLSHEEASEIMLANDLVPHETYPGSLEPWLCRHTVCGRLVEPARANVNRGHGGCKYCSGNAVDDPAAVMLASGYTPLVEYPGALQPWLCRHEACGSEVAPTRANIYSGRGGCPSCANHGYDPSKTGYFYIVWMPDLDLTGFGISNDPGRRLVEYRREGTADGFDAVFTGTGQEIAMFEATLKAIVKELGEVDMSRPAGFKTESLAGDWCATLWDRAERAGLTVIA
jgi:hypothetical protein